MNTGLPKYRFHVGNVLRMNLLAEKVNKSLSEGYIIRSERVLPSSKTQHPGMMIVAMEHDGQPGMMWRAVYGNRLPKTEEGREEEGR